MNIATQLYNQYCSRFIVTTEYMKKFADSWMCPSPFAKMIQGGVACLMFDGKESQQPAETSHVVSHQLGLTEPNATHKLYKHVLNM